MTAPGGSQRNCMCPGCEKREADILKGYGLSPAPGGRFCRVEVVPSKEGYCGRMPFAMHISDIHVSLGSDQESMQKKADSINAAHSARVNEIIEKCAKVAEALVPKGSVLISDSRGDGSKKIAAEIRKLKEQIT